jgi:hypothetical protein
VFELEKKLRLFRWAYTGRPDVYAFRQQDGSYRPRRAKLTDNLIIRHWRGEIMLGAYPLSHDGLTRWAAADFDGKECDAVEQARQLADLLRECEIEPLCNMSQSGKGVHVRLVFAQPIESWIARRLISSLVDYLDLEKLSEGGAYDRPFPTQDRLPDDPRSVGNQIAMPLHYVAANERGGTVLLDDEFRPVPLGEPTWDMLELYEPVTRWQIVNALRELGYLMVLADGEEGKSDEGSQGITADSNLLGPVMKLCDFFVYSRTKPLSYYEWMALASNLAPFEGGREAFHTISSQDTRRYNVNSCDRFFLQISKTFHGPVRCKSIAEEGWRCKRLGDDGRCSQYRFRNGMGAAAPAAVARCLS